VTYVSNLRKIGQKLVAVESDRYSFGQTDTSIDFYRATACNATHGIAIAILSVSLSVC